MSLVQLLKSNPETILSEVSQSLARSHLEHYEAEGKTETHYRLSVLYELTLHCLEQKSTTPMIQYTEKIARQRYLAGFELFEMQTAFNVLEEVIWKRILTDMEPNDIVEAIGLISTILGAGKDTLARTYVSLAAQAKAPSVNLKALFAGT